MSENYIFVGDSTTGQFQLLNGSKIKVLKFSTRTAKGLGKGNQTSKSILETFSTKYKNLDISYVVWMFGNVDVKFSYYYKLCREWDGKECNRPDPRTFISNCADYYFDFLVKLKRELKCEFVVIGAEPNGAAPNLLFEQCVKYFVASDDRENERRIFESIELYHPERIRKRFNSDLKYLCKKHGFKYLDIDENILTNDVSLKNSVVKRQYVDISPTSSHLNWEATLQIYLKKLGEIGLCIDNVLDLEKTREQYLLEKGMRKRKSMDIINQRWQKSLRTHIDDY